MKKYFERIIKIIETMELTEDNKQFIINLLINLETNLTWQQKTSEEKQIDRIIYLLQLNRANIKQSRIDNLEKNIKIYSLILDTMPYFKLSTSGHEMKIIEFCNKILNEIDFRRDGEIVLKISKEELGIFNYFLNYTDIQFIQSKITKLYNNLLEFVDNE